MSLAAASWGTSEWNWGYASGTAHDEAAKLRPTLDTGAKRETFLKTVESGETSSADIKLCFGLTWQQATRREGGAQWVAPYAALVAGEFEHSGENEEKEKAALAAALERLVPDEVRVRGDVDATLAAALRATQFVKYGC